MGLQAGAQPPPDDPDRPQRPSLDPRVLVSFIFPFIFLSFPVSDFLGT